MVEQVSEELRLARLGGANQKHVAHYHILVFSVDGVHLFLAVFVELYASFSGDVLPHLQ